MRARAVVVAVALLAMAGEAAAESWESVGAPAGGGAEALGGYSAGCVRGAVALPADGPGFQVMRPGRRRFFGHPVLVSFIEDLGAAAKRAKLGAFLVGDLAQPRGGPAPSGHSSHQSGLDVDIWFWAPRSASRRPLPKRARERLQPRSVIDARAKTLGPHWRPRMARLLERAARDERVARIFVNPVIKRALCDRGGDRGWLRKLRPWYGHDRHFHVRLRCPAGSEECVDQAELPPGDGCDQIAWWFREDAAADRAKSQKKYQSRVGGRPELPGRCTEVLASPAP